MGKAALGARAVVLAQTVLFELAVGKVVGYARELHFSFWKTFAVPFLQVSFVAFPVPFLRPDL